MDSTTENTDKFNINQAAKLLNVSVATVRNWMKTGILTKNIEKSDVIELKNKLKKTEIKKLSSRANKLNSNKKIFPKEYLSDLKFINSLKNISEIKKKYSLKTNDVIFYIALNYLNFKDELIIDNQNLKISKSNFKRKAIYKAISKISNLKSLNKDVFLEFENVFYENNLFYSRDFLGIIYQSLLSEGQKSGIGSYYTPKNIVKSAIKYLKSSDKFLDPCCGTGSFIIEAVLNKDIKFNNIYAVDIDPIAVAISKLNLLLLFNEIDKNPNIFCSDYINDFNLFIKKNPDFDFIATNPPWGAAKNNKKNNKYRFKLNSNEIFSKFILKSINFLKTDGIASFILPESFLNIKLHTDIRKILTNQTQILLIKKLGKVFSNVFTPVIQVSFKKEKPLDKELVKIESKNENYLIKQKRFKNNENFLFDINLKRNDDQIVQKIYSLPYKTLKNNAKWALGIVTGNNNKYLKLNNDFGLEPIIKGTDLNAFNLKKPSNFIKYHRNKYQQVAKDEIYRAKEKLVYKFISNKLVFAYDNNQHLTLNSANILIPQIADFSVKIVLAFLNSSVFQFLFKKKFSTHKVLKKDLELLPFPLITENYKNKLENEVDKILSDEKNFKKIDSIIFDCFKLNEKDKNYIINTIK